MFNQSTLTVILLALTITFGPAGAVGAQGDTREALLPKDLKLSVELLSQLSTKTNQKGDKFSCKVLTPAEYSGATVTGHVRKAKGSGKTSGKSEIDVGFDMIALVDGRLGSFNAQIVEVFDVVDAGEQGRADSEGTVKAKSTVKRDAVKIGISTAIGALVGGLLFGGKGAAIGAAVGAGVGVSTTLATKGPELEFPQGTQLTLILNSPSHVLSESELAKAGLKDTPTHNADTPKLSSPISTNNKPDGPESMTASKAEPSPPVARNPALPSPMVRVFLGAEGYRLEVPQNWRESSSKNPVTLAPDGGYIFYQGKPNLTHGIMTGVMPVENSPIQQANERFLTSLLSTNGYLRLGQCKPVAIRREQGFNCTLSGVPAATGKMEIVNTYTSLMKSKTMFYLISVVPAEEYTTYGEPFQKIVRSIQLDR